jgi:hypothetical protein
MRTSSPFKKPHARTYFTISHPSTAIVSWVSNLGKEQQLTLWKPTVGKAVKVVKGLFERGRPFTVIRFDTGLAFANIHAGHNYATKPYFEKLGLNPREDDHVIIAGDFNKNVKSMKTNNIYLKCGATSPLKTCCSPGRKASSDLDYYADHILSTMSFHKPTRIFKHGNTVSDHLPIVATLTHVRDFLRCDFSKKNFHILGLQFFFPDVVFRIPKFGFSR